ncbi:hypothetical protein Tco_0272105 [Tanacetum coccineum]
MVCVTPPKSLQRKTGIGIVTSWREEDLIRDNACDRIIVKMFSYEDIEKMKLGSEDYNPPMVHTETFEVTKYKFDNGCSFICVSGENNETLSLGRKNGSRFRKMIMEEMEEVLGNDREDSDDETYNGHESNLKTH